MPNPRFQMSSDTRFLVQRMRNAEVGDVVTFADIEAVTGRPYLESRHAVYAARRVLLRDENIVFDSVRGIGFKRLDDTEIVQTSARHLRKVRRAARNGAAVLNAVSDFSKLSRENQMRHSASLSVLAVVHAFSKETTVKKIEERAAPGSRELPIAQTIAAFSKPKS